MITAQIFTTSIMTLALGFATAPADAAELFALKSATFADGKMMPKKVANSQANAPTNPNCVGENSSPQLSWSNVPDGTKSFVLLMPIPKAAAAPALLIGSLMESRHQLPALPKGK